MDFKIKKERVEFTLDDGGYAELDLRGTKHPRHVINGVDNNDWTPDQFKIFNQCTGVYMQSFDTARDAVTSAVVGERVRWSYAVGDKVIVETAGDHFVLIDNQGVLTIGTPNEDIIAVAQADMAKDLDELMEVLNSYEGESIDMCGLRTFGYDPVLTDGVFSWDNDRILISAQPDVWDIINRCPYCGEAPFNCTH